MTTPKENKILSKIINERILKLAKLKYPLPGKYRIYWSGRDVPDNIEISTLYDYKLHTWAYDAPEFNCFIIHDLIGAINGRFVIINTGTDSRNGEEFLIVGPGSEEISIEMEKI